MLLPQRQTHRELFLDGFTAVTATAWVHDRAEGARNWISWTTSTPWPSFLRLGPDVIIVSPQPLATTS